MKTQISDYKLELAKEAERTIVEVFSTYEPGDFKALGSLCISLHVLSEFYRENRDSEAAKRVPRLLGYLDDKFMNCTVLVLCRGGRHYAYSANYITKFVRGESVHGASDIRDEKRELLHAYVFESDSSIDCQFLVGWNWIAGPNLRSSAGHDDSGGPFVHKINVNSRSFEVGVAESVIFSIAYEFWQANTNGMPEQSTRCFVKFDPAAYCDVWGADVAEMVKSSLRTYFGLPNDEGSTRS